MAAFRSRGVAAAWAQVKVAYADYVDAYVWLRGRPGYYSYWVLSRDDPETMMFAISNPDTAFDFKMRWA